MIPGAMKMNEIIQLRRDNRERANARKDHETQTLGVVGEMGAHQQTDK